MLSEKYAGLTPYQFANNNPVLFDDPMGDRQYQAIQGNSQMIGDWSAVMNGGGGAVAFMAGGGGSDNSSEAKEAEIGITFKGDAAQILWAEILDEINHPNEDRERKAELYILLNSKDAMYLGHLAAALVTEEGVYYISDGGVDPNDPNQGSSNGRGQIADYGPDDIVTDNGRSYELSNRDEAFVWIDKFYNKKFSFNVSLMDGFTFLNSVRFSAGKPYDAFSHNCADVIVDGLHSIGLAKDIDDSGSIPRITFGMLQCEIIQVCP